MKVKISLLLTLILISVAYPQNRKFKIHERSMLRQTVYNTGEVGRPYDAGQSGITDGTPPSMEWPPHSKTIIDRKQYSGQHNSMGGGFHVAATRNGTRVMDYCGAVSDANGRTVDIEGVYTTPGTVEKIENFPLKSDGTINPAFNPNEAEEIIISKWTAIKTGVTVTRTSRAWSYPGYDQFIIYEYEITNPTSDTLKDVFFSWTYALSPSMFGYERKFNKWSEGSYRNNQFARFDLQRWLSYNVDITGKPDTTDLFSVWNQEGDRGGLNSPQAVGIMMLHYDYNNLVTRENSKLYVDATETAYVWDENNKMKQPYLCRYENGNLYETKLLPWYDINARKTGPFKGHTDSVNYADNLYWMGRVKPAFKLGYAQPVCHGYGFGPYIMAPGTVSKFAIAEVIGYGAGVAADSIYKDMGGSTQASLETGTGLHPVQSWYKTLTYPEANVPVGSNYLQTHPLPWYVHPGVVSIRDVADRAIQMYIGGSLKSYNTTQFDPKLTPEHGVYSVPVPRPAPILHVENMRAATNKLTWGPEAELGDSTKFLSSLSHYLVYRSLDPLGPWTVADSISIRDPRNWHDSVYVYVDLLSEIGLEVNYAVVSVDALGNHSGMSNFINHETQSPIPPGYILGKVYVVPNPLIVTNGQKGSASGGEITDRMTFIGLTKKCTIKIYSFAGQLIHTIEHEGDTFADVSWYQVSRNQQLIASGVYFFTVKDAETGRISKGKFVIIH